MIKTILNIDYDALKDLFTLIDTFLTLLIGYVFSRQAFIRWRRQLFYYLIIIWSIYIIIYFINALHLEIPTFFEFLLFVWLVAFCYVVRIFQSILTLELIQFSDWNKLSDWNKPKCEIVSQFGTDCIDKAITEANSEDRKIRYPLIIAADEFWRPWNIAQKFVVKAIHDTREDDNREYDNREDDTKEDGTKKYNIKKAGVNNNKTGVIFFTFARPREHIISQLQEKAREIGGGQHRGIDFSKI
jgi:hypothetical protein